MLWLDSEGPRWCRQCGFAYLTFLEGLRDFERERLRTSWSLPKFLFSFFLSILYFIFCNCNIYYYQILLVWCGVVLLFIVLCLAGVRRRPTQPYNNNK